MLLGIICWGWHGAIHRLAGHTTTAILHAVVLGVPDRLHGPVLSIHICVACGERAQWKPGICGIMRKLACFLIQLKAWQRWLQCLTIIVVQICAWS